MSAGLYISVSVRGVISPAFPTLRLSGFFLCHALECFRRVNNTAEEVRKEVKMLGTEMQGSASTHAAGNGHSNLKTLEESDNAHARHQNPEVEDGEDARRRILGVSRAEERRIVRKLDWALIPFLTLFYLLSFLVSNQIYWRRRTRLKLILCLALGSF